jgi:CMP-N,N'-diacetyllegionaminic acid synthase
VDGPEPLAGRCLALVPARAGSVRVPGKNVRLLAGHPLLAYTIAAARRSGMFSRAVVSTDSDETAQIAREYGAEVPWLRPPELAGPASRDIEWVRHALDFLGGPDAADAFALLRPTSPLRTEQSIRVAVRELQSDPDADSLRAVELCRQHPGKMWVLEGAGRMRPLLDQDESAPWHSTPYQSLPPVHVQNAALEVAWLRTVYTFGTIAGRTLRPFVLPGYEGLDVNDESDWWALERLVSDGAVALPSPLPSDDPPLRKGPPA